MATRIDLPKDTEHALTLANLDSIEVGQEASCELKITEREIERFADLSEDVNPLHLDAGVARSLGFSAPVAHGMLALGAISRLIGTRLPGAGSLWMSQDVIFLTPVFAGDDLTATVKVERISKGAGVVQLSTSVVHSTTGRQVLSGTAKVKVLRVKVLHGVHS